jgi:hypothetical protein
LDSFHDYDFYSEEEINNMPLDIGSHPNIENEEIIILETNAEILGKECEENTLQLLSLPSTSKCYSDISLVDTAAEVSFILDVAASTTNKSEPELKEYLLWSQTPERKGKKQSERLRYVITSSEFCPVFEDIFFKSQNFKDSVLYNKIKFINKKFKFAFGS